MAIPHSQVQPAPVSADATAASSADRALIEHTLSSERVYQGHFLQVYNDQVQLPNGVRSAREYIKHPGAVMVMPVFDNGDVLLERQFRYPLQQIFYEFPAGKKDAGEMPEATAHRELREETGWTCGRLTHVTDIHNALAYSDEVIHFFLAQDLHDTGVQALDEGEVLQVVRMPLTQLRDLVLQGAVSDVKTQLGFFWLQQLRLI